MTVKELILKLQEFDETESVRISVDGECQDTVFSAGSLEIENVYHTADCDNTDKYQVDLYCKLGKV